MVEGYYFGTDVVNEPSQTIIGSFVTTNKDTAQFTTSGIKDQSDPAILKNLQESEKYTPQKTLAIDVPNDIGDYVPPETQTPILVDQSGTVTASASTKGFFTITNILLAVIAIILIIKIFKK